MFDCLPEVGFSGLAHFVKNHGTHFLGRKRFLLLGASRRAVTTDRRIHLDDRLAVVRDYHERPHLHVRLHHRIIKLSPKEPLGVIDRIRRVE
mmetsp:Transcript_71420/g.118696  ORF Transcript_71420/g.118696 Transcript_71420/m.118696 type:complete len:92 (-) Transcript_71420:436-711(-)